MENFFFIVLLAIAFSSINVKAKCVKTPAIIPRSVNFCYSQLTEDEKVEFKKNPASELRAVKCMPKCVLEGMGFFKNGDFHTDNMLSMTEHYVKDHKLSGRIYMRYLQSAKLARQEKDDCAKAQKFALLNKIAEQKERLLRLAFCDSFKVTPKSSPRN